MSLGRKHSAIHKPEVKVNEVILYYSSMGNDISITHIKKDEDHVTGSVLGTFDAKGERIK